MFSLFTPNTLNKIKGKHNIITNDNCTYKEEENRCVILNIKKIHTKLTNKVE